MRLTVAVAAFAVALAAQPASAQFTTVVRPAARTDSVVDSTPIVARRDSVTRATLADLRAWVDSSAALASRAPADSTTVPDSAAAVVDAAQPAAPERTTEFSDGAVAPATASPLPFLALLGVVSFLIGLALLARRRA
ncbi:MAG TPA: hypothetical protein VNA89_06630 [Gemmatimonadaceae bacterium]|nr:hypothetical protein [Gemmatimonadaceae bacterium]